MPPEADQQAMNVVPPRRGAILAITLDATARPYNLTLLTMGGVAYNAALAQHIYLTLQAETANCWYFFHSATDSALDKTAAIAAGATAGYANTHAAYLPAGQSVSHRIKLNVDKWIEVQGSGAGILRIFASSQPSNVRA